MAGRAIDAVAFNAAWLTALKGTLGPVAEVLFDPLLAVFRNRDPAGSDRRSISVNFLNGFARRTEEWVELLLDADVAEHSDYLGRLMADRASAVVGCSTARPGRPATRPPRSRRRPSDRAEASARLARPGRDGPSVGGGRGSPCCSSGRPTGPGRSSGTPPTRASGPR